jgi:AbrB family transcriptional regulator (stage V sporulation protein T)
MENIKATGLIRRIDDLGRVVIPKEIRRQLRIREGDPLELFLTDNSVTFQKYSPVGTLAGCEELLKGLYETIHLPVLLCDRDGVTTACGIKQHEYAGETLSDAFLHFTDRWNLQTITDAEPIPVLQNGAFYVDSLYPIRAHGELFGWLVPLKTDSQKAANVPAETKRICADLVAKIIAAKLEME